MKTSFIEEEYVAPIGHTFRGEAIDLFLLNKYLQPIYKPGDKPWIMDIGASGGVQIGHVMKQFHLESYGIPYEQAFVTGCNQRVMPKEERLSLRNYDFLISGMYEGDALLDTTWAAPFMYKWVPVQKHDLAVFRNPMLDDHGTLNEIVMKSLEHSMNLAMIIREQDAGKFRDFLKLTAANGIEPRICEETGIENDIYRVNCWHTVCVFQNGGHG
jgi:hypothetical protein